MNWFLLTLATTAAVRGFGAGLIWDVALVSLPVRRRLGAIPYRNDALVNLEGISVKTYAPTFFVGTALTIAIRNAQKPHQREHGASCFLEHQAPFCFSFRHIKGLAGPGTLRSDQWARMVGLLTWGSDRLRQILAHDRVVSLWHNRHILSVTK